MHQTWSEREGGNGEQSSRGVGRVGTMAAVNSRDKNRLEKRSSRRAWCTFGRHFLSSASARCAVAHVRLRWRRRRRLVAVGENFLFSSLAWQLGRRKGVFFFLSSPSPPPPPISLSLSLSLSLLPSKHPCPAGIIVHTLLLDLYSFFYIFPEYDIVNFHTGTKIDIQEGRGRLHTKQMANVVVGSSPGMHTSGMGEVFFFFFF